MSRRRESTPLRIGKVQATLAQMLFEDAVLFPQVRDDFKLLAIYPGRQGHEEDPQAHAFEHPPSRELCVSASPRRALGWISAEPVR